MRILLVSTYELGHQPLHVASPAAALLAASHDVRCLDLSVEDLDVDAVLWSDAIAISVPMHTALRLALGLVAKIQTIVSHPKICLYGLYAAVGRRDSRGDVAYHVIAGEYEPALIDWANALEAHHDGNGVESVRVSLGRTEFVLPARHLLPPLERYAHLSAFGRLRLAGYVEASHGCAHRCRHCPVPVVYDGRTRLVGTDVVVADVAQLVDLGAEHITFGDPDFLNGPHQARRVVDAVHSTFPDLTFDVTAKVEHILRHRALFEEFADAGCLFVVSAFEAASDKILEILDKGHSVEDEIEAVGVLRRVGIEPRPSLLPFTPWTTFEDLTNLFDLIDRCDLVGNVDFVQMTIRLLVPDGSLLITSGRLDGILGPYDEERLAWSWTAVDPRLDALQERFGELAEEAAESNWTPERAFETARAELEATSPHRRSQSRRATARSADSPLRSNVPAQDRPHLTEPWFCCAEPTDSQFASVDLSGLHGCATVMDRI
ncbi:MAG: CUAEP/CCAEP-tail radical SAM (seleno)protein [Acidimicrobiales bacterium]|jgi:radical SAM superfamily enzyme YgiQ (UPF0313 family)